MTDESKARTNRARAYRAHRLAEIGRAWGLSSRPRRDVADWMPRADEFESSVLVPDFLDSPLTRAIEWVCRELQALGFAPEEALFWLTTPNAHLSRRVPIDVVELGHASTVVRAARRGRDESSPSDLTLAEAARRLGTDVAALEALVESRDLVARRVAGRWRIATTDFDNYRQRQTTQSFSDRRDQIECATSTEEQQTSARSDGEEAKRVANSGFAAEFASRSERYFEADSQGHLQVVTPSPRDSMSE